MFHTLRVCALLLNLLLLPFSLARAETSVDIATGETSEAITLHVGAIKNYKAFFLHRPERLVVDLPQDHVPHVALSDDYDGSLIKNIRAAHFNEHTVRIVFDLANPSSLQEQSLRDGALMLKLKSNKNTSPQTPEKPLIIIDPGHGGEDPGAIGQRGSQEKDVVFAFAKALESSLLATGKYRVKLTRNSDIFIPLHDRVKMARKAGGNLFISLHADSAPNDEARGLSVYTLSEKASDAEAEALAIHENKADQIAGLDLSHESEDVADILISLAQRETRNQSALLADLLATSLGKRVKLLQNTHRFAGFAVLKAPDIPSVLVETGFISHPQEEKLLKSRDYRQRLITGISEGIAQYFARQKAVAP